MAVRIYDMTVYRYVRTFLYEQEIPGYNIVRLVLDFDNLTPEELARRYKNAIRKCRRIICHRNDEVIHGTKSFKKCHENHAIPYFVLEVECIERGVKYRKDALIEKESIYVVAVTSGKIEEVDDNEFEEIQEEGVPDDLRRVEKHNKWLLLKDNKRTDVKRFKGPWANGIDSGYESSPIDISIWDILNDVITCDGGIENHDSKILKRRFAHSLYSFPEAIRFHDITADIVGLFLDGNRRKKVNTRFPDRVNSWDTHSKRISTGDPSSKDVKRAKHVCVLSKG